jgi:pseudaminic acid synthase
MRETPIMLGNRPVGAGSPAYLIAELSGNHNGDLDRAIETVRAAAKAGANAIKLQTYTADTLTIRSERPDFIVPGNGPWGGRSLYDLYEEAHTPWAWHERLFAEAKACGIQMFSTPFDDTAVDFLTSFDVPAFKIASFEVIDDRLLARVATTGKPVIVSTGMASLEEIAHALGVLRAAGCREIIPLRCTSSYPAPDSSMQLSTIPLLARIAGCPAGLSDHSLGTTAAVVAVTLGACVIEKHFTLSRADGGVDSHFSLEPAEFKQLVEDVRRTEAMIGMPEFGPGTEEEGSKVFRRSLYVVEDVRQGEELTPKNVRSIRPGYGMSPRHLDLVIGKRATRAIARGTPLSWDDLARA